MVLNYASRHHHIAALEEDLISLDKKGWVFVASDPREISAWV